METFVFYLGISRERKWTQFTVVEYLYNDLQIDSLFCMRLLKAIRLFLSLFYFYLVYFLLNKYIYIAHDITDLRARRDTVELIKARVQ